MRGWGRNASVAAAAASLFACAALSYLPARAQDGQCRLDSPDPSHAGNGCARSWFDANLKVGDIQVVGTSESYKQRPSSAMLGLVRMGGKKDAEALEFAEPQIAVQLDANARALEFDIAYDPQGGLYRNPAGASMAMDLLDPAYVGAMKAPGFKVIHIVDIDYNSNCITLDDCLVQVAAWSRSHPVHVPLVISLHPNDTRTPMPGATRPAPFDAVAFDSLDARIRAAFRPEEIITPDMLRGAHATLREAALAHDWPMLGAARGKVIFLLDSDADKVALYAAGHDGLQGRVLFVTAEEASPLAAFVSIDDPQKDKARIAADVKLGFIVKTRADDEAVEARLGNTIRRDAAFESGAQLVITNFLLPDRKIGTYQVNLPENHRATCDALRTDRCNGWGVERGSGPTVTAAR